VSCGAPPPGLPELSAIARRTAAHSTLVLNDADAALVRDEDGAMPPILRGANTVEITRLAGENWTLIDSSHDGYLPEFGRIHHRKIALAADGLVIAGEDRLENLKRTSKTSGEALLRFHLAPDVTARLSSSGQGVSLDAGSAGVWLFSVDGALVSVEESIIFATFRGRQRTAQLVMPVALDGSPLIWRFTKMRDSAA
jgi:uncharacterized heparinase superfamily protein